MTRLNQSVPSCRKAKVPPAERATITGADGPRPRGARQKDGPKAKAQRVVIIADDDDAVCFVLQDVLTRAGWRVIQIRDGGEIWPILEDERACAILLDLKMPGVNGWEVLRRLRSEPELARRRSEFRVVVMSGQSDQRS